MQKRELCENCGKPVVPYASVSLGTNEERYKYLCMGCANAEIAEHAGVDFKHPEYLPMTLTDFEGAEHSFHFNTRLLGDRVAINALEIKGGKPCGYEFSVIGDNPEEDTLDFSATHV